MLWATHINIVRSRSEADVSEVNEPPVELKSGWGADACSRFKPTPPKCCPPKSVYTKARSSHYTESADDVQELDNTRDEQIPEWATFENDPSAWYNELTKIGVDEGAIKQLFLLAQKGEDGKKDANDVVWHHVM